MARGQPNPGQGVLPIRGSGIENAVVFAKDGTGYKVLLVDINLDAPAGGIDVPKLIKDLLNGQPLYATFLNTHPHDDHLKGVEETLRAVTIPERLALGPRAQQEVPEQNFEDLKRVIAKVKKDGRTELILEEADQQQRWVKRLTAFSRPAERGKPLRNAAAGLLPSGISSIRRTRDDLEDNNGALPLAERIGQYSSTPFSSGAAARNVVR